MKLIIDISEEDYKRVSTIVDMGLGTNVDEAICNGTPLEEKIGHWIRQKGAYGLADTCECSVCGRTIYAGNENDLKDYPYCHCGAKMEGE